VGEVGESYIIDIQHWRHYYLIMGVVWGLMVAGRAHAGMRSQDEQPADTHAIGAYGRS
jgi:hypothetical protein